MAEIPDFMGTNGMVWFIGIVEDINDPLQLGRVKVRCFGYHTDNKVELPTEALPWAIHVKPVTTGSYRSPTGIALNTTVLGVFADGAVGQYPIILGSVSGVNSRPGSDPNASTENIISNNAGGDPLINGVDISDEVSPDTVVTAQFLGSLNETQYTELKNAIGKRESSNNYSAVNQFGFIGKYQFGNAALYDMNYTAAKTSDNSVLTKDTNWKGKNGANSLQSFLKNQGNCQELAMDELLKMNYNRLKSLGVITNVTPAKELAGYLAVSHLLGAGGASKFSKGNDGKDGNGTSGSQYYKMGYNSISSNITSS